MKQQLLLSLFISAFLTCWTQVFSQSIEQRAQKFLQSKAHELQLQAGDFDCLQLKNHYESPLSGVAHYYFVQCYEGIEVYNAIFNLHFKKDGTILTWGNRLVPGIKTKATGEMPALISQEEAVEMAALHLGYSLDMPLEVKSNEGGTDQRVVFEKGNLSAEDIPVRLVYQLASDSLLRLAWDLNIHEPTGQHWWSVRIDAATGKMLDKIDWVISCDFGHPHEPGNLDEHFHDEHCAPDVSPYNTALVGAYNVFPQPLESPSHGPRQLVNNPEDPVASPYGWHDTNGVTGAEYTITRGNNVYAQLDDDNNNNTFGFAPDGGASLNFDFPLDLTQPPSGYVSAAVTNLFYWNNYMHDFSYKYGFTEAAGNFQENNYGRGGTGGDYVIADAQDAGGTNNANFSTPSDGTRPRMQMYIWTNANPDRDSDLDNGVIAHEYTHGISNRLTGGPSSTGCLGNQEQMGEGWSDYYALMTTMEPGDQGADIRGIGTYLLGQPTTGNGIRPTPYTTNMAVNSATYDAIKTLSVPHGVGYVWCTMLWDMTWDIIAQHGTTAGFDIAMNLVNEGLKLQPCSPGFVDGRNAILAADQALYNGANTCLIWAAFARRGLGFSANQGSSTSRTDGTQAFDMPPVCLLEGTPTLVSICQPANAVYSITVGGGNGNVSLTAISGVPAGANVSFSPNPVVSPGSSSMTVSNTNAVPPGTYTITVQGIGSSNTYTTNVGLTVHGNIPPVPVLSLPGNNATGITVLPTLLWNAMPEADSFTVQIASDPAFTNLIASATQQSNSYKVTTTLAALTTYYWRVKAINACGEGAYAAAFSFTTANIACTTLNSTNVPVIIPTTVATVTSNLNIPIQGEIVDVNVKNLNITHTWISDLAIQLTSPNGTSVTLLNQPCSDEDNILINLDDEAASSNFPCPPTNNGTYKPFSPLSAFQNEILAGNWTLTVQDLFNQDGGTLNAWGLEVCYIPFPTCDTTFIDSGGLAGNYGNNENSTTTFCPSSPGYAVSANFTAFETEAGVDVLSVYNGSNLNAPLLGTFSGSNLPGNLQAANSTGCLTFQFVSDGANTFSGWQADIVCECPSPGNTLSSLNPACSGQNFTLLLSNSSLTPPGFTFQWQSSTDSTTWTNISGATNPTLTTSQTTNRWYRCVVTCTALGQSSNSVPLLVNVNPNICQCAAYCTPTSGGGNCITGVNFNTLNNSTGGCSTGNYSLQSATTILERGNTYALTVTTAGSSIVSVWIDYNQNGTFATTEWTQVYTTGTTGTVNITIPATATTGTTRMRIRSRATGSANGSGNSCTNFGSGETEDYCITIIPSVPCSGAPTPGNTLASSNLTCSGANFTLSLSGSPITGLGIQYQWQSSPDSTSWSNVSGATNSTMTTSQTASTWYQCVVTCTNSGQVATSSALAVNMAPLIDCYCASNATSNIDTKIDSVFFNTIVSGSPATTCQVYTNTGLSTTLARGNSYDLRIRNGSCSGTHYAARATVYIDYNRNGLFTDAGELVFSSATTTGLNTIPIANITIPATAALGLTGMRIVLREGTTAPPACGTYTYGETEDYLIEIVEPCQPLTWYEDFDGDGYGNAQVILSGCSQPGGYVSDNTDCDDTNSQINVAASEICNGLDDDCDGDIDEGVTLTFFADEDGDGFGDPNVSAGACAAPTGYVSDNTDCNDTNSQINVAASEICNGLDDDCDGDIDEGVTLTFFADEDGDGFGDPNVSTGACAAFTGYVSDNTDCDDTNASIYPGAPEICNNAIDDNCEGTTDESLIIWTGDGDGIDWMDGTNWSNGGAVPQACNDIVVPAGKTVVVTAGTYAVGSTLQVDGSAVLSVDPAGVLTIED